MTMAYGTRGAKELREINNLRTTAEVEQAIHELNDGDYPVVLDGGGDTMPWSPDSGRFIHVLFWGTPSNPKWAVTLCEREDGEVPEEY